MGDLLETGILLGYDFYGNLRKSYTPTINRNAVSPLSKTNAEIPMARTNVDVRFATVWYRTEPNPIFDFFRSLL